jgi:hypothetical protein
MTGWPTKGRYTLALAWFERYEQAHREIARAIGLDPVSPLFRTNGGQILYFAGAEVVPATQFQFLTPSPTPKCFAAIRHYGLKTPNSLIQKIASSGGCMKRVKVLAAGLASCTLAMPHAAHSQLWAGMSVTIPFEFYIGDKKFPPGKYSVIRGANSLASLTDNRGNSIAVLTTDTKNKSRNLDGELVFNVYENRYFLAEIRWQDHSTAGALPKSKMEIEVARNVATSRALVAGGVSRQQTPKPDGR